MTATQPSPAWVDEPPALAADPRVELACDLTERVELDACDVCAWGDGPSDAAEHARPSRWRITYRMLRRDFTVDVCGSGCAKAELSVLLRLAARHRDITAITLHLPRAGHARPDGEQLVWATGTDRHGTGWRVVSLVDPSDGRHEVRLTVGEVTAVFAAAELDALRSLATGLRAVITDESGSA